VYVKVIKNYIHQNNYTQIIGFVMLKQCNKNTYKFQSHIKLK